MINADVEMGGTDQLFNLLAGRELMEKEGMEPQVALTMPLLEGTDGHLKMSKSYGNYVGLTDEPADMFGKVMSIPDEMIGKYYRLASTVSVDEADAIDAALASGEADPYALKRRLAANIVDLYHGEGAGAAAEAAFDNLFKEKKLPENIDEVAVEIQVNENGRVYLPAVLVAAGLSKGTGAARRDIDGGAVKIYPVVDGKIGDEVAVESGTYEVEPTLVEGAVLQLGKRRFAKLV
jgi:tyrosyl-tRNA synthetase